MNRLQLLDVATSRFLDTLRSVGDDQWGLPTPCDEWNVAQLVDHVTGGNRFTAEILRGATAENAMTAARRSLAEMTDRRALARESLESQTVAFAEPGALERTCHHVAGDMPGALVLGFRLTDLTVHAWDLARAIGEDESLPDELVQVVWADVERAGAMMHASGLFGEGASGTLPDDADMQTRLLDATGRRP